MLLLSTSSSSQGARIPCGADLRGRAVVGGGLGSFRGRAGMALGGGVHDLQESLGPGDAVHVPARADRDVPPGHGSHAVVAPRAAASSDSVSASSGADSDDDDDDDDEFVDSWGDRRPYWLPCLAPRWAGALIQRSARQAEPGGDASIYIRTLPGADVLAVIAQQGRIMSFA